MSALIERNLLFGILALQREFIGRDVLATALKAWVQAKQKGLGQILREQKTLSENQQALLEECVAEHIAKHTEKSLAMICLAGPARQELEQIDDPDVRASLAQVSATPIKAPEEEPIVLEVAEPEPAPVVKKAKAKRPVPQESAGIPAWILIGGGVAVGCVVAVIGAAAVFVAGLVMTERQPVDKKPDDPIAEVKPKPVEDQPKPPINDPIKPKIEEFAGRRPTTLIGGDWRIEGDELVGVTNTEKPSFLSFGSKEWTDYDLAFDTHVVGGPNGSLAYFRVTDADNHHGLLLGASLRTAHEAFRTERGERIRDLAPHKQKLSFGTWYAVRIEARGNQFRCFIDGKKVLDYTDDHFPNGQVALAAPLGNLVRWKNIKVTDAAGKVMWEGLPELPPLKTAPPSDNFVSLFNGKDLAGWKTLPDQKANWRVKDGVLVGSGNPGGRLYTERADFGNFHLRAQTRISDQGAGGVAFRAPFSTLMGYQAKINSNHIDPVRTGSVYAHLQLPVMGLHLARVTDALVEPNEWFTMDVLADGPRLIVMVNGKTTADVVDKNHVLSAGHIALNQIAQSVIEFRTIEIKEGKPAAPPPVLVQAEPGFTPLFNGKDLTGWKQHPLFTGKWRVENGILIGSDAERVFGYLQTDRPQPKDFHLRVEARVAAHDLKGLGAVGAIFFRGPEGSLTGYETQLRTNTQGAVKLGNLNWKIPGKGSSLPNAVDPTVPVGQWSTIEVIAQGSRFIVKVDGVTTANVVDATIADAGHVGLLQLAKSVVEFRKIEIKELKDVAAPPVLAKDDFVTLFNGNDLTGWKAHKTFVGEWRVDNGVLIGAAPGMKVARLLTEAQFKDFHLRAEVRGSDKCLAGVFIRSKDGAFHGYNASMISLPGGNIRAGILNAQTDTKGFTLQRLVPEVMIPPGQWFKLEMIAEGNRLIVLVDGKKTTDALDANIPGPGVISLGLMGPNTIEFRKIEIKELKDVAAPPVVVAKDDFVPLFNGKDLTGWKPHAQQPGEWRVVDGVLTGASPGNGHLLTTRGDFKDFHLRVEARAKPGKSGGVRFRYTQDLEGYETTINQRTGGVIHIRKNGEGVQNVGRLVLLPGDDWSTLDIIAKGNRLTLKVNGKTTVDDVVDNHFASGHICLYDFKQSIEFRKIEIKELKDVAAPPVVVAQGDFVPLFNGKDLTGWQKSPSMPGDWRVEKGVLTGDAPRTGILHTVRGDFKDFHLRAEARFEGPVAGITSGILIRSALGSRGYESPFSAGKFDGSLFLRGVAGPGAKTPAAVPANVKSGEWFTLEFIAVGNRIKVIVNGKETIDFNDIKANFASGQIALRQATNHKLEFRKIEIKELKGAAEPPVVAVAPFPAEDGFVPLFNGNDLTGWKGNHKVGGDWRVVNGVLTGTGPNLRELFTQRDDFGDFHLRLEGRINDDGNGFVVFRYPHGLAELDKVIAAGYAARISSRPLELAKTGSLYVYGAEGTRTMTAKDMLAPAGQWFNLEIIAKDNLITLKVNGKETKNLIDAKQEFKGGRIVLGFSDTARKTVLEFRKIEIKEFKAVAAAAPAPVGKFLDPVPLFNRVDLTGWRVDGNENWKVNGQGHLIGEGPDTAIITNRKDFKNFNVRVTLAGSADVEAFLAFRENPDVGGKIKGLTTRIFGDGTLVSTGTIGLHGSKNEKGQFRAQVKPDTLSTLEIEVRDDSVRIFSNGRATSGLQYAPGTHPPGAIGLHVARGSVRVTKFEIAEEAPSAPPLVIGGGDWAPIFNGKDLAGWQSPDKLAGKWRVENGVLIGDGPDASILHTARADFQDFHLRAEARFDVPADADSGVLFRSKAGVSGYETSIIDGKLFGSLAIRGEDFGKNIPASTPANIPNGEWFTLELLAQGNRVQVRVNGKVTADFIDAARTFTAGSIALRQGADCKLEFRKIEIKEAKAVALPPVVIGKAVPMFNAKDLDGWQPHPKRPGNWRVENGVLIGSAPIGGSLYSARGDYQDFLLRAEVRINDKGFARIFTRAAFDPAKIPFKVVGYETLINQRPVGDKTGALTAVSGAATSRTEAKESAVKAGEWFTLEVIAKGDLVTVKVEGAVVAEYLDDKRQFARTGHIVLHQDANAVIEFRKVEIEELAPAK